MYKDGLDEPEEEEEEGEDPHHKDLNMKEKLANYFLAKNKRNGISQGWEVLSNILFLIDQILTVFEKFKNLIFWKSPTATMYILFLLMLAYLGLAFLPIRYLLIGFYIFKFKKGFTYYERIYKHNIECGKLEICRFLGDKNFDFCNEWPKIKNLEKKLNVHLQKNLLIFLPNDWLKYYSRPIHLLEKIGNIKTPLMLSDTDENEAIKRTNPLIYKKKKNAIEKLYDYLMNNCPSDFYLLKHSEDLLSKNYI